MSGATELYLIRHAPVIGDGCLYGRRDLPADCSNDAQFERLRAMLPDEGPVISSPAQRCLQTAQTLWPDMTPHTDDALWEQNFGDWEGMSFADIPDQGEMDGADLAAFAPPGGESFDDLCARVAPALEELPTGPVKMVVHAGVIRAVLSTALGGVSTALRFDVANLSLSRVLILPGQHFVIREVNTCC